MLISAVEFTLKVLKGGTLSLNHGRLLHAAFLNLVREQDENLSAMLHDSNKKCFALDLLRGRENNRDDWQYWDDYVPVYTPGQELSWRVTGLVDEVTNLFITLPKHSKLKVGTLLFEVISKEYTQKADNDCGLVTMAALTQSCAMLPRFTSLTLDFLSPTSFKFFNKDYPFPRPELIFGSIVDRWNEFSDYVTFDPEEVRRLAVECLIPDQWTGRTTYLKLTEKRSIKAFIGSFTYNLTLLDEDALGVFILLAEYAKFCGVGRLTGQGFGRVKISYK